MSKCKRIFVGGYKGGVGKSLTTESIAGELAINGARVGILDLDSQPGNVTYYLGIERTDALYQATVGVKDSDTGQINPVPLTRLVMEVPPDSWYTTCVTLVKDAETGDEMLVNLPPEQQPPMGQMLILPGGDNTFRVPNMIPDVDVFRDVVEEYEALYQLDYLVIDTGPTRSFFDGLIFPLVDFFVLVTEAESGSLTGLVDMMDQINALIARRIQRGKTPPVVLGIIPNKLRLKEHYEQLAKLVKLYPGQVSNPLRFLRNYSKLAKYAATIRAFAPHSDEAREMWKALQFVLEKVYA